MGLNQYTYQIGGFRVFLWRLLKTSVRCSDSPVTLIDESKNVGLVFCLEASEDRIIGIGLSRLLELRLEPFSMRFWTRSKVHFLFAIASV